MEVCFQIYIPFKMINTDQTEVFTLRPKLDRRYEEVYLGTYEPPHPSHSIYPPPALYFLQSLPLTRPPTFPLAITCHKRTAFEQGILSRGEATICIGRQQRLGRLELLTPSPPLWRSFKAASDQRNVCDGCVFVHVCARADLGGRRR